MPGAQKISDTETRLFKVNLEDESFETHAMLPIRIRSSDGVIVTPDGRTIVILKEEYQSDIWLVEDFDPEYQ
jgi:hypothetical protein